MRQMHVNRKYLNVELQRLIFRHLQKKSEKMKEDLNFFDKNLRSKIIGQRGDGVLEREGLLRDFKCESLGYDDIEFQRRWKTEKSVLRAQIFIINIDAFVSRKNLE
ncbi:hypothetical protein POTOM_049686 [Populus tomentosa]|uniref:Uncharacterized protein n=1 Tax=Populus tomentosa TaxID=118781 RepID=A0A8X8CAL6_POPTO|nr:hypothetical protein POTOM_049686 [Populus tomentosa]